MLVLSRKVGEAIQIGDDVTVYVTEVDRGKVKIGIEAPRKTEIARTERVQHALDPRTVGRIRHVEP